jgi:hypothetical protein
MVNCNTAVAGASPDGGLDGPASPDACRHKEQAVAVERIDRPIVRVHPVDRGRAKTRTDPRAYTGAGPVVALIRSLLMLALAALAILGLLPAVVAAQAAATL